MKKLLGLALFLLGLYCLLLLSDANARSPANHFNLGRRIGLYGILTLGAGCLIISGGIDLSIGSVVGLCATVTAMLLVDHRWSPWAAIPAVLALGVAIGLVNGLLVTKLGVQAFVVTLCGLFIFRGAARWLANDSVKGLGGRFGALKYALYESKDVLGLPMSLVIFLVLAALFTVFLHLSVYGRYLYAIGGNEQAARYAGVATDRYKILAYVLSSGLAAFFAVLFLMEQNSVQPTNTGNFFELYAIAGAVLGGCSLRGGEGNVLGMLIGTAILWILPNLTRMWGVPSQLEYTVIGGALLLGALLDERLRRRGERRGVH
ncbi:MAG TPA: ABC transporter permease [Pirellulales bacterium]|nr:ABC transporter permease [Pirellulales bacterium]